MLKKTITFKDYFGNERTQDFYFNLNESELTNMNLMVKGGLERQIKNIIATQDQPKLIEYFKSIILASYGEISEDGIRFVKSEELSTGFSQTDAFNKLYMELVSDAEKAADFINGIVPQELADEANKRAEEGMNPALAAIQDKPVPLAIPKKD